MKIEITTQELQALLELAGRAQKSTAEIIFLDMLAAKAQAQISGKQQVEAQINE